MKFTGQRLLYGQLNKLNHLFLAGFENAGARMNERLPKQDRESEDENRLKEIKSKISSLKAVNIFCLL